jgi:hypothetical protein
MGVRVDIWDRLQLERVLRGFVWVVSKVEDPRCIEAEDVEDVEVGSPQEDGEAEEKEDAERKREARGEGWEVE